MHPCEIRILLATTLLAALITACGSAKPRSDVSHDGEIKKKAPSIGTVVKTEQPVDPDDYEVTGSGPAEPDEEEAVEQKPIPPAPKVGLILGPGAIKAFAHIGVLQEFARKRVQIHSIAGLEFGALIAGFYAVKGQPFEPEWQLFKIKEDDLIGKQLLTSAIKSKNPEDLRGFFASTLPKIDIDETRVPFTCPIWDLNKNQTLMMTRGSLDESLMTCMSFAPLYQPFQDKWIGAAFDLKSTSDQLRSQGANLIIYVNVIGQNENLNLQDYEKWLWSLTQGQLQKQMKGVDYVVNVDTSGIGLADFGARKVLVQKGVQAAKNVADQMIQKFGL